MRKSRSNTDFGADGFEIWGGYMAAKKAKLQDQFSKDANKEGKNQITTTLFNGISIFVNGYTIPTADSLKRIMMLHGGQFHHYYSTDKTTYIIASNLADTKVKQLKGQPKVVKPAWITDCVSAFKLLDYRPYLLYSNQSKLQPKISFPVAESFHMTSGKNSEKLLEENVEAASKSSNKNTRYLPLDLEMNKPSKSISQGMKNDNNDCRISKSPDIIDGLGELCKITINTESTIQNHVIESEQNYEQETSVSNDKKSSNIVEKVSEIKNREESSHCTLAISPGKNVTRPGQKIAKAGEANFLTEFYSHSRLHHISTMGSMFKKYISDLRKNHNGNFPGRVQLITWKKEENLNTESSWQLGNEKIIMHIDMDCFFVSVGLRSRPDLKGLPVAVTHARGNPQSSRPGTSRAAEIEVYKQRLEKKLDKNKISEETTVDIMKNRIKWTEDDNSSMSEIASCSYEARKAGLKNGMFLGPALKMCPNLKTIPYDFDGYKDVSYILYDTVASFTLDIESVSCDEMFVDCTSLLRETNTAPLAFASFIRSEIKKKTGCPASTGFGGNILQSRLATRQAKPDGQFHLLPHIVTSFMENVKIEDLPGVGRNLAYRLRSQHLLTCGDLQKIPLPRLQAEFGNKTGLNLHQHCKGLDDRALDLEHTRKSVSAEINYGIRFTEAEEATAFIRELSVEVQSRLQEITKQGRCITLKIMAKAKNAPSETAKFMGHGVCDSMSKSSTLAVPTSDHEIIAREAIMLLGQLAIPPSSLRGMGIQVSKLTEKSSCKDKNLNDFFVRSKKIEEKTSSIDHDIQTLPSCNKYNQSRTAKYTNTTTAAQAGPSTSSEYDTKVNITQITGMCEAGPSTSKSRVAKFCDLDPEFLAALPPEIRAEVLQEYKHDNPETSSSAETFNQNLGAAAVTYSQIDPSFLEALPDDLRAEVICDLQKNRRPHSPPPKVILSSPSKFSAMSPRKRKNSPRTKAKYVLPKGQQKIKLLLSPTKTQENFDETQNITQLKDDESSSKCIKDLPTEETNSVLNPAIPIKEALELIREWVDTENVPQDIDVELMSEFLQQLVRLKRIDKVEAMLRTMHRKVETKTKDWKKIYINIVAQVQLTMMQEFQAELKVMNTF